MNDGKSTETDPWRELRNLNDLDLGVAAYKAENDKPSAILAALPITDQKRFDAAYERPGGWVVACTRIAEHGARIRAALPPPPDAELDALSTYLGQPRGRLLEGAQRLVDHNDDMRASRDKAVEECKRLTRAIAGWEAAHEQVRLERDKAEVALLAIGQALDVVGTGKPWAEIGKAGVAAVNLLQAHLKTARQGWADESAAACRARVERDKSRAECATLSEQVASLRKTGADTYAELTTLRDAARTLLPADSTPNPATGWLADVIRSRGATITSLRASLDSLRDTHTAALNNWHDENRALCESAVKTAQHHEAELADIRGQLAAWRDWGHKTTGTTGALDVGLRTLLGDRLAAADRAKTVRAELAGLVGTGQLMYITPTPAAKPDPLAGLRAVLARVPELYSNLPAGDPRGVMAACNLYAAGWRADRPLAAAHRAMDWTKRQRQLAQEAFSDGLIAGMGVEDLTRAA